MLPDRYAFTLLKDSTFRYLRLSYTSFCLLNAFMQNSVYIKQILAEDGMLTSES